MPEFATRITRTVSTTFATTILVVAPNAAAAKLKAQNLASSRKPREMKAAGIAWQPLENSDHSAISAQPLDTRGRPIRITDASWNAAVKADAKANGSDAVQATEETKPATKKALAKLPKGRTRKDATAAQPA